MTRTGRGRGSADGSACCRWQRGSGREKTLARPTATAYEIHHGRVSVTGEADDFPGGCRAGAVWGTIWHGLLDGDAARHAFLAEVAVLTGKLVPDGNISSVRRVLREQRVDRLADAVEEHLDTAALLELIEHGPPGGRPSHPARRNSLDDCDSGTVTMRGMGPLTGVKVVELAGSGRRRSRRCCWPSPAPT